MLKINTSAENIQLFLTIFLQNFLFQIIFKYNGKNKDKQTFGCSLAHCITLTNVMELRISWDMIKGLSHIEPYISLVKNAQTINAF